jgi:hypothetical protein
VFGFLVCLCMLGSISNFKLRIANYKLSPFAPRKPRCLGEPKATLVAAPVANVPGANRLPNFQFEIGNLQFAMSDDPSVASGRRALDSRFRYPWYDPKTDDVRPITPPRAEEGSRERSEQRREFSPSPLGPVLQVIAWTVLGLALAAVVYLLVRAFLLTPKEKTENEAGADLQPGLAALPLPLDPGRSDLLAQARRFYEQGDYRQAIIYLFSFQLVQLDKRQIIHLAKGKTNRQYLREVGPRQALRWLVEQTMVAFEDVFFGNRAIDRGRFESCWSRVGEFERLAAEA